MKEVRERDKYSQELLSLIEETLCIAEKDPKDLEGQFVKFMEESGELARVGFSLKWKRPDGKKFKEESVSELVDVLLMWFGLFVKFKKEINFTMEEFFRKWREKNKKWTRFNEINKEDKEEKKQ